MEALVEEVRRQAKSGDEKTRKDILDSLSKLYASIETPDDTVQRFTFYVCHRTCNSSPSIVNNIPSPEYAIGLYPHRNRSKAIRALKSG